MKICVAGLWHLGSVTATCLAQKGFQVTGWDPESSVVNQLAEGKAPIYEPGLDALIAAEMSQGHLTFISSASEAVKDCDFLWITFDTPVDDRDVADAEWVKKKSLALFKYLKPGAAVLVSSQLPVGTCAQLEASLEKRFKTRVPLCCSPENLRLGKAIDIFQKPDRLVAGIRVPSDQHIFMPILSRITERIEWMKTESAEMTKHAINSFLATSVVFANELAVLCEAVGADAREVEKGLKTESRIGPKAYVKPGAAFAGGTLARDVRFLTTLAQQHHKPTALLTAILKSNETHKKWARGKLKERMGKLKGRMIAILGLTYKEGTDTLRRSWPIEVSRWLHEQGAKVQAFDWQALRLPSELKPILSLKDTYAEAMEGCDALVMGTDHPAMKDILPSALQKLRRPLIIDPNGSLNRSMIESLSPIEYCSVGYSVTREKETR